MLIARGHQPFPVADGRHNLVAVLAQQPGQALAQQRAVFGQDCSIGLGQSPGATERPRRGRRHGRQRYRDDDPRQFDHGHHRPEDF
ncbi:hypothetical protein ABZ897_41240 [Nonomuraea sp. NPDC046802]|uniref:hypothetical protein n=1 Tax=Nonomuraea sp. NPDC046802 TaxID=3154919 RepID=UPI0033C8F9A2